VAQETGLARVVLINDLVAMAWSINALGEASLASIPSGLERIPVRVILKTETAAMLGAAYHAARILKSIAAA
jgi:glucokinase